MYGPECYDQSAAVYFDTVDPSTKDPTSLLTSPLAAGSVQQIVAGGLISPLMCLLYIIAGNGVLLRRELGIVGMAASFGFSVTVIGAACYHTGFVYTAFIAKAYSKICAGDIQTADCVNGFEELIISHATYMRHMKEIVKIGGFAFTAGFVKICFDHLPGKETHRLPSTPGEILMPWFMVIFAPSLWLFGLRETGKLKELPAPYGGILAGGSFNICLFVFFFAVTLYSTVRKFKLSKALEVKKD